MFWNKFKKKNSIETNSKEDAEKAALNQQARDMLTNKTRLFIKIGFIVEELATYHETYRLLGDTKYSNTILNNIEKVQSELIMIMEKFDTVVDDYNEFIIENELLDGFLACELTALKAVNAKVNEIFIS